MCHGLHFLNRSSLLLPNMTPRTLVSTKLPYQLQQLAEVGVCLNVQSRSQQKSAKTSIVNTNSVKMITNRSNLNKMGIKYTAFSKRTCNNKEKFEKLRVTPPQHGWTKGNLQEHFFTHVAQTNPSHHLISKLPTTFFSLSIVCQITMFSTMPHS